jgi:hypothetical protein
MASSPQRNHAFIYDMKIASRTHYNRSYDHAAYNSHAMFASSSTLFMVEVGLGEIMLCLMLLEKCAINPLSFIMLSILLLYLHAKIQK